MFIQISAFAYKLWFLFNISSSLITLIIHSFSVKHNLHKSGLGLTFVIIIHLTEKMMLSCFSCRMYFANSVLFSYFLCLKSLLWFLHLSLKALLFNPKWTFSSSFELLTKSAWYITDGVWHSPLSGHSFFILQLHPSDCCFGGKLLWLWEDIIELMFLRQL